MRYPLIPPYAERREFHRPFWEMLSAAMARLKKSTVDRVLPAIDTEVAKSCH